MSWTKFTRNQASSSIKLKELLDKYEYVPISDSKMNSEVFVTYRKRVDELVSVKEQLDKYKEVVEFCRTQIEIIEDINYKKDTTDKLIKAMGCFLKTIK